MTKETIEKQDSPATDADQENVISLDDARMRQTPEEAQSVEVDEQVSLDTMAFAPRVHSTERAREEVRGFLMQQDPSAAPAQETDPGLAEEISAMRVGLMAEEAKPESMRRLAIEGLDIADAAAERFSQKLEFPTETPMHEAAHEQIVARDIRAMMDIVGGAIQRDLNERGIEYSGDYDQIGIKAA